MPDSPINENPRGLLEIEHVRGPGGFGHDTSLYCGEMRYRFRDGFDPESSYTFLRSAPGAEFARIVRSLPRGPASMVDHVYPVMTYYYRALHRLFNGKDYDSLCGSTLKDGLLSYSLVRAEAQWPAREVAEWPVVHVVKDKGGSTTEAVRFASTIDCLTEQAAFDLIRRMEAPQNYHLHIFDALFSRGVAPIKLHERKWEVDGQTLKNALDFMDQFVYSDGTRDLPVIDAD